MTKRERMLETAAQYHLGTYSRKFVAPVFQSMVRAEVACEPKNHTSAIVKGKPSLVFRGVGQCVCVTCGKVGWWSSGLGGMHTGHFLASRRASILYEEDNVAPQCSACNRYRSGAPLEFRIWMEVNRGTRTIERLERLKEISRQFTREELVDLRLDFQARLAAAKKTMKEI